MSTAKDKKEVRLNMEVATTIPRPLRNAYRTYLMIEPHKEQNGTLSIEEIKQITGYTKPQVSKLISKGNKSFWIYKWHIKQQKKVLHVFSKGKVNSAVRLAYKEKEVLTNRKRQTSVATSTEYLKTPSLFSQMLIGVVAESPNRGRFLIRKGMQLIKTPEGTVKRQIVRTHKEGLKEVLHYKTNASISRLAGYGRTKVSNVTSRHENKTRATTRLNFSFKTRYEAVAFIKNYANNKLGEYMLEQGKRVWFNTKLFHGYWYIYEVLGTEYKDTYTKDRAFTQQVGVRDVGSYQAYTTITRRSLSNCFKGMVAHLQLEEAQEVGYSVL
jgi:hypothetical protein